MTSSIRHAVGLKLAQHCSPPSFVDPKQRRCGAKLAGLRYERSAAKSIGPRAMRGLWFEFWDSTSHAWCQPDIFIIDGGNVIILEVKYTWVPEASEKLRYLYGPVLGQALGLRPYGIVVCKKLTPEAPEAVYSDLGPAISCALASSGRIIPVVHWLGKTPLWASPHNQSVPHGVAPSLLDDWHPHA